MRRRIFVAIHCTPALQEQALRWQKESVHAALPVRWLAGRNLHITLIPPWYEEEVEEVKRRLRQLRCGKFMIAFDSISFGPQRQPRLIWATGKTPEELAALQSSVEGTLGVRGDGRLMLHMTLARFRPEDFRSFPVRKLDERVSWSMPVESIVLMESRLSSVGAEYEVLEKVVFGSERNV